MMPKKLLFLCLLLGSNLVQASLQQQLLQLNYLEKQIQQQSLQIANVLDQQKVSTLMSQDRGIARSWWIHEFSILDSMQIGKNTIQLYLRIPTHQRDLPALIAHHNIAIAARNCSEHAVEIKNFQTEVQSLALKQALQIQFQRAKDSCSALRIIGSDFYNDYQILAKQMSAKQTVSDARLLEYEVNLT
jgi:hypothetical protein